MDHDPVSGPDWWKRAVFYQIYPRSFQDSNGDGIGDLPGIISRLDYLNDGTERSLGIDAIWLSPTFPSPMKDFGYDVSDYTGVHPDFGTMDDMDRLIDECHRRNIRVLLDWVPNHTSDQHPWFIESRSSRDNPKRDWYIWRDGRSDGSLPNNWRSVFGGPAWEYDPKTGQYYLHSFLKEQPDLNWRNPDVEAAMHDTLRFWLDRGIDGFRIDVMGMIVKHPQLLDNPPNPHWRPGDRDSNQLLWVYNRNYEDVYPAVARIRSVFDEYEGRMAVGEVFGSVREIGRFYRHMDADGLHLAFNFHFITETEGHTPWTAAVLHRIVSRVERELPPGAHPCYAFGNHDRPRFVSRHDEDGRGQERARAACLLLLGLRSSPFLYYGEEIGMEDVDIPEDQLQDPARYRWEGRDPERTPMQWDDSPGRGFTTGKPWLPFGRPEINVAAQAEDAGSLLSLYRRALRLRKTEPSLHSGDYHELPIHDGIFAFRRHAPGARPITVYINTALEPRRLPLDEGTRIVLSTDHARDGEPLRGALQLAPLEAVYIA